MFINYLPFDLATKIESNFITFYSRDQSLFKFILVGISIGKKSREKWY